MGSFDPRQLCNASVVLDEGLTAIVKTGNGGIGPPKLIVSLQLRLISV